MSDFLNWELTNRIHNLGYDGKTLMYINDEEDIINDDSAELIGAKPAILTSAAFRWFREKYNIHSWVKPLIDEVGFVYEYQARIHEEECSVEIIGDFYKIEEAELACLTKLIEIVKSEKQ